MQSEFTCNPPPITLLSAARGAVAQLGERSVRNAEVEGSIPFGSTNKKNSNSPSIGRRFFFSCAHSTIGPYSIPLSFEMSLCCSLGAVSANS